MKPPRIEEIEGYLIVRDDQIPGGTKVRVLQNFMEGADEHVYASPAYGYAQVALSIACKNAGKKATIFTAARKVLHPRTLEAQNNGATIQQIPYGYMSNVRSKAISYSKEAGAHLFPFGMDFPEFVKGLANVARSLNIFPREVWCVAGSGVLCRALRLAWPNAQVNAVQIGSAPNVNHAQLYKAPENFYQNAKTPPPFPSCSNYDAKAWQFIKQHASPGALFWNVA